MTAIIGQQAADEESVKALYENHWSGLLRFVVRLTGDWAAAEDVAQETFVRAWRHFATLRADARDVRNWLLTVARHIVVDRARARAARPPEVADAALLQNAVSRAVHVDHWDEVDTALTLSELMTHLTPEKRAVVAELFYRGSTVTEAAGRLGLPQGTVKSRSHRALADLRAALDAVDEPR